MAPMARTFTELFLRFACRKSTCGLLMPLALTVCSLTTDAEEKPPYHGTIFIAPKIITAEDPSEFLSLEARGAGSRTMFDRRENDWIRREAWLFEARFAGGQTVEVQVNPEFDEVTARKLAERYLPSIGRLPRVLRKDVRTIWIHDGDKPFGGGNQNLLIHTGMAEAYLRDGILEETLCHEAAHTSLDAEHARAPAWLKAQAADGVFISTYARENPTREDIAESFLLYMALRHRGESLPEEVRSAIQRVIPHRVEYFDSLHADMRPFSR